MPPGPNLARAATKERMEVQPKTTWAGIGTFKRHDESGHAMEQLIGQSLLNCRAPLREALIGLVDRAPIRSVFCVREDWSATGVLT